MVVMLAGGREDGGCLAESGWTFRVEVRGLASTATRRYGDQNGPGEEVGWDGSLVLQLLVAYFVGHLQLIITTRSSPLVYS